MNSSPTGSLSSIERQIIGEIRLLRASSGSGLPSSLLESPIRMVHHFILASHGNVRLRIATMARELGVEMRTLERSFAEGYGTTMTKFQTETRIAYSRYMLSVFPPTKIAAVAALLGYDRVQDFNRFFKTHMRQSPSAWGIRERERIARENKESRWE